MLAIIGIPTFLLELKIGQYSAMGPVTLYSHLSPLFKGLGFVNFISQCFVSLLQHDHRLDHLLLLRSLTSELPWQYCHNDYNDQVCFSFSGYKDCEALRLNQTAAGIENNIIYLNRTCIQDPAVLSLVRNDLQSWYGSEKKKNESCEADDCEMVKCIYTNTTFCDATDGAMSSITKLFDIPVKLRKSSSGQYLTKSVLPGICEH
eukprot:TRINITY_DN8633_c0_g1_i1.p1 TRINITY_DN8633_c0_g1~~TRINITY_DN8633_c0_g1_i1.p1  ORF type:complete len:204 (+),score=41.48 TRINITY_DN8633_c0_g1_i1:426-1037(+)